MGSRSWQEGSWTPRWGRGRHLQARALGGATTGSKITNGLEERNGSIVDGSSPAKKACHSFCTGPMQKKTVAAREVYLASGQAFLDGYNPKDIIQDTQATGLKVKVGFGLQSWYYTAFICRALSTGQAGPQGSAVISPFLSFPSLSCLL